MNLQNENSTKMQTKQQQTQSNFQTIYKLEHFTLRKTLGHEIRHPKHQRKKLKVNGNLMAQMPPEKHVTVNNL